MAQTFRVRKLVAMEAEVVVRDGAGAGEVLAASRAAVWSTVDDLVHAVCRPLARSALFAAALLLAVPAFAAPAAEADIRACTPDAMKFCKPQVDAGDFEGAGKCMFAHRAELSPACRAVFNRVQAQAKGKNKKRPKIAIRAPVPVPLPKPKPEEVPPAADPSPPVSIAPAPVEIAASPEPEPPPAVVTTTVITQTETERKDPMLTTINQWAAENAAFFIIAVVLTLFLGNKFAPAVLAWFKGLGSKALSEAQAIEAAVAKVAPALSGQVNSIVGAAEQRVTAAITDLEQRVAALEKPAAPQA